MSERPDYHLYGPALTFTVLGAPVGQGRISFLGKGRPAIHSNQDRLLPWRELVQHAAEDAIKVETPSLEHRGYSFPLAGPVGLYACFTLPKAKSAPKNKTTYPTKRPDGSHLLRAVEDALTNAGVWLDDSQLVDEHICKVYPGEHFQALHVPGVLIRVYTVATRRIDWEVDDGSDRRGERGHVNHLDDDRLGHDTTHNPAGQDGADVPQRAAADLLQRDGDRAAHGADPTGGTDG